MARHHTPLQRRLDLKPIAFNATKSVVGANPLLRRLTGFFPDFGWPARAEIVHESRHDFALFQPRYEAARTQLSANVDTLDEDSMHEDLGSARRVCARISNVLIPGHTITPVDPDTGKQIVFDRVSDSRWHFAHPAFVALSRRRLKGTVAVIPPYKHYGHLLTDILMPLGFALGQGVLAKGETLTIVTGTLVLPFIRTFIEGLRSNGFVVEHTVARPFETLVADSFLYARTHTRNVEHLFATPEAIGFLRKCFTSLGDTPEPGEPRRCLYLTRGRTRLRQVENEERLIQELTQRNFKIFEANWANHSDQIRLFSEADVIVGIHGAGLSNVLWAKPSAHLIEIMSNNGRKTTGLHWAAEVGLSYTPVFGSKERGKQAFRIEVGQVLSVLDRALEKGA
jgi:hypothetical protein